MVIVLCIILQMSLKSRQTSLQDVHILLISMQHLICAPSTCFFLILPFIGACFFCKHHWLKWFTIWQHCQQHHSHVRICLLMSRNDLNRVELIDNKKRNSYSLSIVQISRIRVLTFVYACMVFTRACIISYYNLISGYIFPSENINSQFYQTHVPDYLCAYPAQQYTMYKRGQLLPLVHIGAYENILR